METEYCIQPVERDEMPAGLDWYYVTEADGTMRFLLARDAVIRWTHSEAVAIFAGILAEVLKGGT